MTSTVKAVKAIYIRRIRLIFRARALLFSSLIQPALWIMVVATTFSNMFSSFSPGPNPVGIDYLSFMGAGIVAMTIIFTSLFGGMSLVWDREFGILKEFLAAPISRAAIPIGNAFAIASQALLQAVIILIFGFAIGAKFQVSLIGLLGFAGVALLLSLVLYGLAASVSVFVKATQSFMAVMNLLTMPLFFVSGSIYPIQFIPIGLKQFAASSPVTHGVGLLRFFLLGENYSNLDVIWPPLGLSTSPLDAMLSLAYLMILSLTSISASALLFRRATMN